MKVAVFGLGYAGTVSAACLTKGAHDVWGVDVDAEKVDAVAAGSSPVAEPGLDELVHAAVAEGTLHATTDSALALDGADVAFVCVGTPSSAHGRVDLSQVERAVREIVSRAGTTTPPPSGLLSVVIRSTVPPGTIENVVAPALAGEAPPGRRYGVAMCPEFLREGSGVADFFDPPFTVIGTHDPDVGAAVAALFEFVGQEPRIVETRVAEALKYACNAFHATKVSFANELARLLRSMDVDARTVMDLFCEDTRLNISPSYLRPGFAFGGHKGSALASLSVLLSHALVPTVDFPGGDVLNGTFILAVDAGIFRDRAKVETQTDEVLGKIKATPPAAGFDEVLFAGEPEVRAAAQRRVEGIPVAEDTWADIVGAARIVGVTLTR